MAAPKPGGFKLSLAGAKGKSGFKGPLEKLAKRPRLDLGDDEPEDENKQQEIVGWDATAGGAVELNGKKEEDKGPRIIPVLPDRNWRGEARKKLAQAGGHPGQNGDVPEVIEAPKISYGLTTFQKEAGESGSPEPMDTAADTEPKDDGLTEEQRLEKNALDALIHGKATDQTIIPVLSEREAFRNDIHNAPDAPTLEAYEATPIEGFGAALLRGMGWKDDGKPAAKPKEIKRRPALLGIGAKEEAAVGIELGAWGHGKKKVAVSYTPVTLKNKRTGEMISEDELKARMEAQKLVQDEKPSRSNKYDEDDERRREKRKERKDRDRRDDDYDSERRKDKDRRRDKDDDYSDRERRREKKKYRDDDYDDSDRRREKRREKDRRDGSRSRDDHDRRDKGKERDRRHRSRSPDSDERKEKRRERDRRDGSRGRDSEDRRKRRRDYDDDDRDERKRRHTDDKYYKK